jgi:hypothetical protein
MEGIVYYYQCTNVFLTKIIVLICDEGRTWTHAVGALERKKAVILIHTASSTATACREVASEYPTPAMDGRIKALLFPAL